MADDFDNLDYNLENLGADVTPEMLDTIRKRRELREAQQTRLSSPLQYLAAGVTGIGAALQGGSGMQAAQSQLDRLNQEKRILASQEMQDIGALSKLAQARQQKELQNIKFEQQLKLLPFKEKMRMSELAAVAGNQQALAALQSSLNQDLERLRQTGGLEKLGKEQEFKAGESEKDRASREKIATQKISKKDLENQVPGMIYTGEFAPTVDDAKKIKAQKASIDNTKTAIDSFLNEFKKNGFKLLPGSEKNDLKSTFTDIQLKLKEANNLGAITGPDMALMLAMLKDPTSIEMNSLNKIGSITNEGYFNSINSLKTRLDNSFNSISKAYGFELKPLQPKNEIKNIPSGKHQGKWIKTQNGWQKVK